MSAMAAFSRLGAMQRKRLPDASEPEAATENKKRSQSSSNEYREEVVRRQLKLIDREERNAVDSI